MSKKQVMAEIIRHTSLSDGIFDMTLKAEEIAKEAKAGQFTFEVRFLLEVWR